MAAPIALVATVGVPLAADYFETASVYSQIATQFAFLLLGPALGITAMVLAHWVGRNPNPPIRVFHHVLLPISLFVCLLYWLTALFALSSMSNTSWPWFW